MALSVSQEVKIGACAFGLVAILGGFATLLVLRANLKADLAAARADVALCRSVNDDWKAKTEKVEAALRALKASSEEREKRLAEARLAAEKAASAPEKRAASFRKMRVQGPVCSALLELLHAYREKTR